jgi:hypothetical protein
MLTAGMRPWEAELRPRWFGGEWNVPDCPEKSWLPSIGTELLTC